MTLREAYEMLLGIPLQDGENSIKCFCGEHGPSGDSHNSCSLNTIKGVWVCHASGNKGDLAKAIHVVKGTPLAEARKEVKSAGFEAATPPPKVEKPPIADQIRNAYIRDFNNDKQVREFAHKKLGWEPETCDRFDIGWSTATKRYTIPIYDENGDLRNIRMYDPKGSGVNKMISWENGYGTARLFPILSADAQNIIICEGEKDTILLSQHLTRFAPGGWAAITGTGGAGTWKKEWNRSFDGKDVVIIYDRDDAGAEAAKRVAAELVRHAVKVRVVVLDIGEPRGADITNYFQDSGKTWDDLKALIEDTEPFTPQTRVSLPQDAVDETLHTPHLSDAADDAFWNKKLKLKLMVSGKEVTPFYVPRTIDFECDLSAGKLCAACALNNRNGAIRHEVDPEDPYLIELTRMPPADAQRKVGKDLGIITKCHALTITPKAMHNLLELSVVPEIDYSSIDKEYVTRTAYHPSDEVRANATYIAEGTSVPHPKTGHVVHYIRHLKPAQTNVDQFEMTDKKRDQLMIFQPKSGQSVAEKMHEIAVDLSLNVTKIYGREDLVKGIDLCYHTVLNWSFQDKAVAKGWGDILIIGDTRTGKTETIQGLIAHYKLGEMSLGENTSFAGLVGGLRQSAAGQWQITWGRIPLNNRRLLVIDEMSGLTEQMIGDMSGIRSNGVAEMTKIVQQQTHARTRMIWLSNPRDSKSMSQYGHGVEAIKALVGRPEDIARFDFVMTAATNEVPIEEINTSKHASVKHRYTSSLCQALILWAWSRKPDQVVFTDEATERILELAIAQSKEYASDGGIPLVEGGNHRIKLAKLAVAAACRTFSTDDTGQLVIVTPEHADYAASFLDECYKKASLDYWGWSQTRLARAQVDQAVIDEAEEWCRDHSDWAELWLLKDDLRLDDFKVQFDLETKDARGQIFVPLAKLRMIERGKYGGVYHKTPAFVQTLKKVRDEIVATAGSSKYDGGDGEDFPF